MLGIGLYDGNCEPPSSIRVVKRRWAGRRLLGPAARSLCRRAHSKQLIFRIRDLLEYGHHTRDAKREQANQRCQSEQYGRVSRPRNIRRSAGQSIYPVGIRSNSPILALLYCMGGPGLAQFMRAELDRTGRHFRRHPCRAAEWAGFFSSFSPPTDPIRQGTGRKASLERPAILPRDCLLSTTKPASHDPAFLFLGVQKRNLIAGTLQQFPPSTYSSAEAWHGGASTWRVQQICVA